MNQRHLSPHAVDRLRGARGRGARRRRGEHHVLPRPHEAPADAAVGDEAGVRAEALLLLQPLRVRPDRRAARRAQPRAPARSTSYAAAVGRWLVTRDGFDFLAYYLSDFDFASHAHGPLGAEEVALERTDAAIQALLDAAGGPDEFLERYAVMLLSDHGQTPRRAGGAARGAARDARRRHRRHRVEPRRAGLPPARRARRRRARPSSATSGWTSFGASTTVVAPPRGRRASSPGRRRRQTRGVRAARRIRTRSWRAWLGAREPERRRAARLGRAGLGVRRPRRAPPRGRRQPRLARRGRLGRARS